MKSFNSFGVPRLPSADCIMTEGLPDGISPRRNNPQLEKFRNNIRSSLFSGESTPTLKAARTQSTPMGDAKSTGDLEAVEQKSDLSELISPNNSRLDQVRSSLKGSLFLLSHKSSGISPSHDNSASPTKTLMQPIEVVEENLGAEEHIKPEEETQEGLAGPPKFRNPFVVGNSESPESYEEDDSPVDKNDIIVLLPKQSIFLDTVDLEIEELKTELKIDQHSKIHFIQGSFCKYYKEGDVLGEGTSGVVKKCSKVCTKEQFAVKIVQYKGDMEILTLIIQEFQNLLKLNHKNVVKVYELYVDYFKKKIYNVMELAECREMFEALKDLGHYSEAVASGIMKQIFTGINYLHLNGVCHRDIKPNNILVSNDGQIVKITDFNVSKFLDKKAQKNKYSSLSTENYKMWTYTGTIAFTAPEVFIDSEYTERVDVWSAGVVLYTMLCGYQPFHATHVKDLIELIKEGKYTLPPEQWDSISDQAKDLIKHCLDVNCKTRYSPADALMHPWIANQVKVSDRKISFKDNFRVYYKKYTGNKKNYACAVQMKKVQVTSPHIAVASPAIRLKRRSGTNRVMELYTKGGSNDSKVLKEVNSAGEETKETCSSVLEELNEESPLQRTAFFEPEELEILTALNRDRSCSSEFNGRKKSQEKAHKALQEIANESMPQTLKLRPVIEAENKRCSEGENKLHACEDNLEDPLLLQSSSIENQISS